MLVPHRQQSATASQSRIDIGAPQPGQAQASTPPSSQISPGAGEVTDLPADPFPFLKTRSSWEEGGATELADDSSPFGKILSCGEARGAGNRSAKPLPAPETLCSVGGEVICSAPPLRGLAPKTSVGSSDGAGVPSARAPEQPRLAPKASFGSSDRASGPAGFDSSGVGPAPRPVTSSLRLQSPALTAEIRPASCWLASSPCSVDPACPGKPPSPGEFSDRIPVGTPEPEIFSRGISPSAVDIARLFLGQRRADKVDCIHRKELPHHILWGPKSIGLEADLYPYQLEGPGRGDTVP